AAVGTGLFKVGQTFDEAFDTIRVGTGATGDALDSLKDDFRAVVRDVPADFESASTAVADLNTRLGLTGAPLQDLAKQTLELTRITGGDRSWNVESVTRMFGDWGVEAGQMDESLDAVFRASQATGPSVDRLSQLMVKFGSPLRQLGFGFEET